MAQKNIIMKRRQGLYLGPAGHKGRGVFCTGSIRAGEVLEVTPAIILNEAATRHVDHTLLVNYTFEIGKLSKPLRDRVRVKKTHLCSSVVMGVAAFCNHSEEPNADINWEEQKGTLYYILKATRRIPRNTEICTTYGDGWFDDRDE
jgi:hypothetical protein